MSRKLVVDASVARASGKEGAAHPTSKNCRDFLMKVLDLKHKVVFSPEISEEWKRHQSSFARKWRVYMAGKKLVHPVQPPRVESLRKKLLSLKVSDITREAITKDILLLEAALVTDKTVISLDNKMRDILKDASCSTGQLKDIVWVNPDSKEEVPLSWVKNGALPEPDRKLGYNC